MVLVTGSSGLVGSHLINLLLAQGQKVRALYNKNPLAISHINLEPVQADILDVVGLEAAMAGITHVYHCAAIVSFGPKEKKRLHQTNVDGTANIVDACLDAGVQKMVYVSSVAALGRLREGAQINETMNWSEETSNSEYGRTKYLAEMEVWRGMGEGLDAVIVNPSIILGCGDWDKGSTGIFKSAYNEFPWFSNGVSGFVDVQDVAKAMVQLMGSNIVGERFIISGANIHYKELFTQIAQQFGKKPPNRQVTKTMAAIIWRLEAIKGMITGKKPLLTKETAHTAQTKAYFDNAKLLKLMPSFAYTPINDSIKRICGELKAKYNL